MHPSAAQSISDFSAPADAPPIRVALADDSLLVREALERILEHERGVELVASCADRASLLAAVERERPAVVVTDVRMPPRFEDEGIEIARTLQRTHPQIGVVVLSQYADPWFGRALLEHGSDGRAYLLKERVHDRRELLAAIETVAHGGSVMDAKVVEAMLAERARAEDSPLADLSPREHEILGEIAQGKSNARIAEDLVLTKRAVEKHINAIFLKLGLSYAADVSRRVKAALLYLAEHPS
ncbi:MAG TPA: response regulator transcription factor [Conexibacter sp.]|nr:response regulator transcription factor [Conexibacter sp.]